MGLRDVLRKKDRSDSEPPIPEFTLIRSDTYTEEVVYPPGGASHNDPFARQQQQQQQQTGTKPRHSLDVFRSSRSRSASAASATSSRTGATNIPTDLPEIGNASGISGDPDDTEAQWEKRAMILARSRPSSPNPEQQGGGNLGNTSSNDRRSGAMVSTSQTDELIQQAIAFHEDGNLAQSTRLFGQLADPNGANNPLSQVLYGLALRHGWGCTPDPDRAVLFLSKAASNAAAVEQMALQAGLKKGGAAKGELVLAIFELANCFRHGWGIGKDPIAAKQYYETAANLGDTDAMNEVAWCYLEGFGCKKDKFAAARYYRLAEKNGNKTLGNSCYALSRPLLRLLCGCFPALPGPFD
ncbi:unnamed protein product [Parascedosporium putredinis]|uniref:HCP-like protein n=1 Tax=Parascedosporium putredinis TaxID=1442378 RepID=A0A9P1H6T7_9PEZI|nr:unnamed protein product [Parascedosporium putredinis]CAI7998299.1 unnamed protein product [Parascedosporium putredinis]